MQPSISIHALREEGDGFLVTGKLVFVLISIHALREEGDPAQPRTSSTQTPFLSTPSARRATSSGLAGVVSVSFLSTPSARRATWLLPVKSAFLWIFLSTPSARRATVSKKSRSQALPDFYPRPPRGGRLCKWCNSGWRLQISIHALREEGDSPTGGNRQGIYISIHALREEGDMQKLIDDNNYKISIHALREEGDR